MFTVPQQFEELIKNSQNILIILKPNPSTDHIASGLALKRALEKNKKTAEIVSENFHFSSKLKFLPNVSSVKSDLGHLQKFIIRINTSKTKVEEFSYDQNDDALNIYLEPAGGMFRKEDVSMTEGEFRFDAILVVGAPDLESLGKIHSDNSEFFYETPTVNIDHKPSNEHFGQINIIDLVSSSCAEIIFSLVKQINAEPPDADLATLVLAGMIAETKSFQKRISPQSLKIASGLIDLGARRDEIIHNLYFTKSLSLLKLWGKVLTRLQKDEKYGIVWSYVSNDDLKQPTEDGLEDVMEELITSSPEAKIIIFFTQVKDGVSVLVQTVKNIDASMLVKPFTAATDRQSVQWTMPKSLPEAQTTVLDSFRKTLETLPK